VSREPQETIKRLIGWRAEIQKDEVHQFHQPILKSPRELNLQPMVETGTLRRPPGGSTPHHHHFTLVNGEKDRQKKGGGISREEEGHREEQALERPSSIGIPR
jgi:hypothetical protein